MRTTTLALVDGFEWHGKQEMDLPLREPTGHDHAQWGDPRILVQNADGAAYYVEQPAAIRGYCEALIRHEAGSAVLGLLTLADSMALREAIFGFFTAAAAALALKRRTS